MEKRGGGCADDDLAGLGGVLHRDRVRGGRPRDDQLAVRRACEEEVERPRVDAHVHAQRDLARGCVERAELVERAPHAVRRVAGARGMCVALEEEQERIAAELHEAAAVRVRDGEQACERRAHHVGHLFGAARPERCEALRHRGEAGDVDEGERPLERPVPSRGRRRAATRG